MISKTMAESSKHQDRQSNRMKRRRQSLGDDDTESAIGMPPVKQQILESYINSADSGLHRISSPLSTDEGCSSICLTEGYSPQSGEEAPHDILSPEEPESVDSRQQRTSYIRKCPLPTLSWADRCDVWNKMCERDAESMNHRSVNMLDYHPSLKMRMRAILLDWLNEVSYVHRLYRETFHLCVNYIDRYLTLKADVPKNRLQLIGITCLFIAAKVEQIYPPKISEFAYVTDGACTVDDLLTEEVAILKALDWKIAPMTTNKWLRIYLQLYQLNKNKSNDEISVDKSIGEGLRSYTFFFTQYSSMEFVTCAQLVDLALLHVGVNEFKYSQLAAAAIAHIFDKKTAMKVSSYTWKELRPCYLWLTPFVRVLDEVELDLSLPECVQMSSGGLSVICPNINVDQAHRQQVHNISLSYFDKVEEYIHSHGSESDEANCDEDETESESDSPSNWNTENSTNTIIEQSTQ